MEKPRPQDGDFARKLNRLFEVMHPRNRGPYSNEEVAEAISKSGETKISSTYIWQLRTGRRDNPTKEHMEALAEFFGVNPAYFFDSGVVDRIDAQLDLIGAMKEAGVTDLALRVAELSPESYRAAADMVQHFYNLDRRQQGDRSDKPPKGEPDIR